jgi:hypothetical protein
MVDDVQLLKDKKVWRADVEKLGVSSWIAVVCNPWLSMAAQLGLFGIDAKNRKATLWKGRDAKIQTTTLSRLGDAVAALLSQPEADLAKYKNKPFYTSSFRVTQRELLDSMQRVTGTTDADWEIATPEGDVVAKEVEEKLKADPTDFGVSMTKFAMLHFQPGMGGDYADKLVDMDRFGFPKEDLDQAMKEALSL